MIEWLNKTEGKTRSEWVRRVLLAIERGALVASIWQDEEKVCILAVMSGDVDDAATPCLDAIGPLWLREFIYMAHDASKGDHAWAKSLCEVMLLWPDNIAISERVEHRMRAEVILPEVLKHFDHAEWPKCARAARAAGAVEAAMAAMAAGAEMAARAARAAAWSRMADALLVILREEASAVQS